MIDQKVKAANDRRTFEAQQLVWDRVSELAVPGAQDWRGRVWALQHQIIAATQSADPTVDRRDGVVHQEFREDPRLNIRRFELLEILRENDPYTREFLEKYGKKE